MHSPNKAVLLKTVVAAASFLSAHSAIGQMFTNVDSYVLPTWHSQYQAEPIMSVSDSVPLTGNPSKSFQMIGIPDGIGVHVIDSMKAAVFINHEVTSSTLSRPIVQESRVKGSFVSRFVLDRTRRGVLNGGLAFDNVYNESVLVGPIAREDNSTPAFSRFCSGSIGGAREGLDRTMYFCGEESDSGTFDSRGGSAVAIFDNAAWILPGLGHFSWENLLVQPRNDYGSYANKTVIMLMEDGDAGAPYSSMYMYVGTKNKMSMDPLVKNGLVGGQFYVLRGLNEDENAEYDFFGDGNATACEWVRIPNVASKTATVLKAAVDAQDQFKFSRVEDGAWSKTSKTSFYFVTTGGDGTVGAPTGNNKLGRVYQLNLDPMNPIGYAQLEILGDADHTGKADMAVSPDNIDTNARYLMVQEDGTGQSRPVMAARKRDASIWQYDLWNPYAAPTRVAQQTSLGRDGNYYTGGSVTLSGNVTVVTPATLPSTPTMLAPLAAPTPVNSGRFTVALRGIWETSGIHATDAEFGDGSFIYDVQAHSTPAPAADTVADGQLGILLPVR